MNTGKFDKFITIETPVFDQDGYGEQIITGYTTFHEAYAQELSVGGGEKQEQLRNVATNTKKWKIRFFDGITPSMRIDHLGVKYDILEIQRLAREGLIIKAESKDDR